MIDRVRDSLGYGHTIAEMFRLSRQYRGDVAEFSGDAPARFYDRVRSLPYIRDPQGVETVARPAYTLRPDWTPRDCDDKTVLLGAYAELCGIPYRFVAAGKGRFPQHVYPEFQLGGVWLPFDATYPDRSRLGKRLFRENFRRVFEP